MKKLHNSTPTIYSIPRWVALKIFKNPHKYGHLLSKYASYLPEVGFLEAIKDRWFR